MKQKPLRKYDEITAGSKITLAKTSLFKGMNDEIRTVKKGTWYITGFWADIVGLSKIRYGSNEVCIKSVELRAFNEVE